MFNLDESIGRRREIIKCHFQQGVCMAGTGLDVDSSRKDQKM
jgi:hypothetical protein